MNSKELTELPIRLQKDQDEIGIYEIRPSSNPDTACVRIKESQTDHSIIILDLDKNVEVESHDISHDAIIFQDAAGAVFVA